LLQICNLEFSYRGRLALTHVDLKVNDGEYLAILGGNGSGKSTLLSCINGLVSVPAGTIKFTPPVVEPVETTVKTLEPLGPLESLDPANEADLEKIRRLCATVLQNPDDQIVCSTVEEDAAFMLRNAEPGLSASTVEKRVLAALSLFSLENLRDRSPHTLSEGEKQRLALAGALTFNPPWLLLDEALSMLDPKGREHILDTLDGLHTSGKTIITVTHSIEEAERAERIIRLDRGQVVYDGPVMGAMNAMDTNGRGRDTASRVPTVGAGLKPAPTGATTRVAPPPPGKIIDISDITYQYPQGDAGIDNINLSVTQGSTVALIGKSGSGKSTLLKHINALLIPQTGRVVVNGKDTSDKKIPLQAFRKEAAYSVQNPESALFETYIADDIAWGLKRQGIKGEALKEKVFAAMEEAGLPPDLYAERKTLELSGGEKRRAALAGVIALDSPILLFDEPAASLDQKGQEQIKRIIAEEKARGKTIIASTHSFEDASEFDIVVQMKSNPPPTPPASGRGESFSPPLRAGEESSISPPRAGGARGGRKKTELNSFRRVTLGSLSVGTVLRSCLSAWWVILLLVGTQILFNWPGDTSRVYFQWGWFNITAAEIGRSLSLTLRLLILIALFSILIRTVSVNSFMKGLNFILKPLKKIGLPVGDISMVVMLTFNFIPILANEAERIMTAQLSRGGKGTIATRIAIIKPLILRALERSEKLAAAMSLRLYKPG
jgi:energy-coupling factor transport system ATP-binding protein